MAQLQCKRGTAGKIKGNKPLGSLQPFQQLPLCQGQYFSDQFWSQAKAANNFGFWDLGLQPKR